MAEKSNTNSTVDPLLGQVFKEFRQAKGFSQKEAAGQAISVPLLSRFESGKSNIAAHRLFQILNNICVNMFEFQYSYEQHVGDRDVLLFNTELSSAYLEGNIVKLELILKKITAEMVGYSEKNPAPKKLRLDCIRVKAIIASLNPSTIISETEKNFLINFLQTTKEWGEYEIFLLSHTANIIDGIKLYLIGREMINPNQKLMKLHYIKHAMIQTVLNIINTLIDRGEFAFADTFISYLETTHIHEYYMYEKLTLIYDKAKSQYLQGNQSALYTLKKCKEILIFCDCLKTANIVEKELSSLPDGEK